MLMDNVSYYFRRLEKIFRVTGNNYTAVVKKQTRTVSGTVLKLKLCPTINLKRHKYQRHVVDNSKIIQ